MVIFNLDRFPYPLHAATLQTLALVEQAMAMSWWLGCVRC